MRGDAFVAHREGGGWGGLESRALAPSSYFAVQGEGADWAARPAKDKVRAPGNNNRDFPVDKLCN